MEIKKIKIIISILIIILVISIVFVLSLGSIEVNSVPPGTPFTINKETKVTPFIVRGLFPGNYEITTTAPYFADHKEVVKIRPFDRVRKNIVLRELSPIEAMDKEAAKWTDYFKEETKRIEKEINRRQATHPLTKHLPYFTELFWFDYKIENGEPIYFLKSRNHLEAFPKIQEWIRSKGIDPATIKIINE